MPKTLKGLDDFFAAGYTPADLLRRAVPADVYLLAEGVGTNIECSESSEWGSWASPTSLDTAPVPEFPLGTLPRSIETYTRRLSIATQTPLALASGVALGALSVALAKKFEVVPRYGWMEPLVLWILVLLPSGERKTAVMSSMRGPLDEWGREKRRELAPLIAEAESRREILQRRKAKAEQDAAKSGDEEDERYAAEVARELAEHEAPSLFQLTTSDVTAEAAAMLCAENDGRIGVWSDEGEIVKIIAGRYSRDQSPDTEIFLKGHAGGYYSSSRVSRGSVSLRDPAIPMVLALQPEVIRGLSNQRALHGQGFFARPLYALPPSALGGRKSRPELVDDAAYEAYSTTIKALLDMEAPKDEFGEAEPHTLRFSEGADRLLEDFQDWIEPQLAPSGVMASYREWGSKLPGAVVRIAGVLHVAERVDAGNEKPWETSVERSTLKSAIKIGCYYREHAKATMHQMGADPRIGAARHVLDALEGKGGTKISKRDLFQKVRWDSRLGTMKQLEPVIELLKDYGYLRELEAKRRGPGRPKSNTLEINPLPPTQNSQNTQKPPRETVKPFFEWLEERHGPEDPDDSHLSGPTVSSDSPVTPSEPSASSGSVSEPRVSPPGLDAAGEPSDVHGPADPPASEGDGALAGTHPSELVKSLGDVEELATTLREEPVVALDLEMAGLDPRRDPIRLMTLATERGTWLIDNSCVDIRIFFEMLAGKTLLVHNAMHDMVFLRCLGFRHSGRVIDTMTMSRMVYAGQRDARRKRLEHSLEACCERELGRKLDKTHQKANWSGELSESMLDYAATDAQILLPLYETLLEEIRQSGQERALEIEERAVLAGIEMAYAGAPVDKERWLEIVRKVEAELQPLYAPLDDLVECPPEEVQKKNAKNKNVPSGRKVKWNWNSSDQIKAAAASRGLTLKKTGMEYLKLAVDEFADDEFVRALVAYKEVKSGLSTYGEKFFDPTEKGREVYVDGRLYPSWKMCEAETGRMSCAEPNVQNIPSNNKLRKLRTCVVAPEGRRLVSADYSQIELRIAARIAGEEAMLEAFRQNIDIHSRTVKPILGTEDDMKDGRKLAKGLNLRLLYGMGPKLLRNKLETEHGVVITIEEAYEHRKRWFEAYSSIRRWHRQQGRSFNNGDRKARTLAGCLRRVGSFMEKVNHPVQGSGADGLKLAMAYFYEQLPEHLDAKLVLVCHDEFLVECRGDQAEEVAQFVKQVMVSGMEEVVNHELEPDHPNWVTIDVEPQIVESWGGA